MRQLSINLRENFKTLAISKIVHFVLVKEVPSNIIIQLNNMQREFIWKNENLKIIYIVLFVMVLRTEGQRKSRYFQKWPGRNALGLRDYKISIFIVGKKYPLFYRKLWWSKLFILFQPKCKTKNCLNIPKIFSRNTK